MVKPESFVIANNACHSRHKPLSELEKRLKQSGFISIDYGSSESFSADNLLYSSCARTSEDIEIAESVIRHIIENHDSKDDLPLKRIFILGCLGTVACHYAEEDFSEHLREVCAIPDETGLYMIGNEEIEEKVLSILRPESENISEDHYFNSYPTYYTDLISAKPDDLVVSEHPLRVQCYIEDGCTNRCGYCKSNYIQMDAPRSASTDFVLGELQKAKDNNTASFALRGENICHYKSPQGDDLSDIIKKMDSLSSGLPIICMEALAPQNLTPEIVDAIIEAKSVGQIYISLDSLDNDILRSLNRNFTIEDISAILKRIRQFRPDITVSTSYVPGLPGETEAHIEAAKEFLLEHRLLLASTPSYLGQESLPSEKLPNQVTEDIKIERALDMIKFKEKLFQQYIDAECSANRIHRGKIVAVQPITGLKEPVYKYDLLVDSFSLLTDKTITWAFSIGKKYDINNWVDFKFELGVEPKWDQKTSDEDLFILNAKIIDKLE